MESFFIGKNKIGNDSPCFIVAELSCNHRQDIKIAFETIEAMAESGADAVKLQTFTPDTITLKSDRPEFRIGHGTLWDGRTLYDLYQEAFTPWEWHADLKKYAEDLNMTFFSSPFDATAVDFLVDLNVPAFKIASFEITDIPLIEKVARTGLPIVISTGIAEIDEIEEALAACRKCGNDKIVLLKCTSAYPAPLKSMNIKTIPDMMKKYSVFAGLSDHSLGNAAAVAAVALGAKIIEKHFILDRSQGGPDSQFSLEPQEFAEMVRQVRDVEKVLGSVTYDLSEEARANRIFSRSLFVVQDIKKGEKFTEENIRSIRPASGLSPKYFSEIIGKSASVDIERGTPLSWDMIK